MSAPFAQITSGPATSTGKNPNQQGLILDKKNNIVESVGDAGMAEALQKALVISASKTALTTVTTAQTLISKALNAGMLNKSGRSLEIVGSGIYTSPGTTTPVVTVALVLGSVTLASIATAALSATASTNMPFRFRFLLNVATTGASGTLEAHGQLDFNISANTPAAAAATYLDTNTAESDAVDLTSALTLKVTVAADSAVSSIQLRQARINLLN